jgi:hypothetical protein
LSDDIHEAEGDAIAILLDWLEQLGSSTAEKAQTMARTCMRDATAQA